jgi:hypothetical protein
MKTQKELEQEYLAKQALGTEALAPTANNSSANSLADYFNIPEVSNMSDTFNPMPFAKIGDTVNPFEYAKQKSDNKNSALDFMRGIIESKDKLPLMLRGAPEQELSSAAVDSPEAPQISAPKVSSLVSRSPAQAIQSPEGQIPNQSLVSPQNPLEDTQMKAALEMAGKNRESANWNSMMADLSNGIIGQAGIDTKGNRAGFLDKAIANADQPVTDINTERDAYKKFLSNNEEMEKADPNSAVSKTMRDALSGMGVKIPGNASYSTMEKLAPQLMKNKEFQMRMQEMGLKREELSQNREINKSDKKTKAAQDLAIKYQNRLQSDPIFKGVNESLSESGTLKNLLEDAYRNGGQSVQALGTRMAKFMGEKGMLSEADTRKYISNPSLFGKAASEFKLKSVGKLNKADYDNVKRLLGQIENAQEAKLADQYKYHAKNFSKVSGLSENEARNYIDPNFDPNAPAESSQSKTQQINPQIEAYAKQHNLSYEKANSIIEARKTKVK